MSKPIECQTPKSAKLIEVIETVTLRGDGKNTIARLVTQYWSKDGKLLAENDPDAGNAQINFLGKLPVGHERE